MSPDVAIHRFEYDGCHVVVKLDASTSEEVSSGHADFLQKRGQAQRRRLALVGTYKEGTSAMASLHDRSRAFIDEWDIQRAGSAG